MKRTALRKRNPARRKSEFARCYGSKERVEFVKAFGCGLTGLFPPCAVQIDNAHTENGGRGRKGDFTTIIPLCRNHHRSYDEHRAPFDIPAVRDAARRYAAHIEELWQRHTGTSPELRSATGATPGGENG